MKLKYWFLVSKNCKTSSIYNSVIQLKHPAYYTVLTDKLLVLFYELISLEVYEYLNERL